MKLVMPILRHRKNMFWIVCYSKIFIHLLFSWKKIQLSKSLLWRGKRKISDVLTLPLSTSVHFCKFKLVYACLHIKYIWTWTLLQKKKIISSADNTSCSEKTFLSENRILFSLTFYRRQHWISEQICNSNRNGKTILSNKK